MKAVKDWIPPRTQTDVRGFLGLTTYFKRFIKGFAKIAVPLTDLTKADYKRGFVWTKECQEAFDLLKQLLTEAPVLKIPDYSKPFVMVTDASQVGLGGVLLQEDQPCAFESKKFSSAEVNYTTTERELFATVHCLQKWAVYMRSSSDNVIETDHMPNTYFNTKPNLNSREIRWMDTLQEFPGTWQYKPGKTNIADALSRMPSFYLMAYTRKPKGAKQLATAETPALPAQTNLIQQIRDSYKLDPSFESEKFEECKGLYYYRNRIVIPNVKELRDQVLSECHDSRFAGHMGKDKTLELLNRLFYWPKVVKDVAEYVASCPICQTCKPSTSSNKGLLKLPEIAERPWLNLSVDFITGLPLSADGHNAILTVVDRCTKMIVLVKTVDTCGAEQFAQLMEEHVFSKHGLCADILHDRDPRFTGHFFEQFCKAMSIHQSITSAWHPQSDG